MPKPNKWKNTHWIVHTPFYLQTNVWSHKKWNADDRDVVKLKEGTIFSVISNLIDPNHINYEKGDLQIANYAFVEVLWNGEKWCSYVDTITMNCIKLT